MIMPKQYTFAFRKIGFNRWMVTSGLVIALLAAQYFPLYKIIPNSSQLPAKNNSSILEACGSFQPDLPGNSAISEPKLPCCGSSSEPCCCSSIATSCPGDQFKPDDHTRDEGSQFISVCGPTGGGHLYQNASLFLLSTKRPPTIVVPLIESDNSRFNLKSISKQQVGWQSNNYKSPLPYYLLYNTYRC